MFKFKKRKEKKLKVKVDDNYHFGSEGDCYTDGEYASLEEAIERCKEITLKSLDSFYEEGISAEDLSAQWAMFGDDPFVFGGTGSVPFSARKFITPELCQEIIASREAD